MANQTNSYIEEVLEGFNNLFGEKHHKICEGKECICKEATKRLITKALQKQQDIIKECLPVYENIYERNYRQQFLDNLSKRGINLE